MTARPREAFPLLGPPAAGRPLPVCAGLTGAGFPPDFCGELSRRVGAAAERDTSGSPRPRLLPGVRDPPIHSPGTPGGGSPSPAAQAPVRSPPASRGGRDTPAAGGEGKDPAPLHPGLGLGSVRGRSPLPARPLGPRRCRARPACGGVGRVGGTEGRGGGMGRGKAGGFWGRGTPRRDPSVSFWPGGRLFGGVNQAELLSLRGRVPPPRKKRKLRRADKRGLARSPYLRQGEQPFPVG